MTDHSTTLVIHHDADLDGLCCREIARRALPGATLLGYDYGRPVPDLAPWSTVYLMDISLPVPVMREHAPKIVLLDHHRTCIEAVQPFASSFKGYYCIEGVAACRLAWQWLIGSQALIDAYDKELPVKEDYLGRRVSEPYAVQLLGEYDIWDKRNPDTDLFQLGMQSLVDPNWDYLFDSVEPLTRDAAGDPGGPRGQWEIREIVNRGRTIQAYTEVTNAQISQERGFDVQWEGLSFRALNTARSSSLTFTAALKPHHDGCLSYFWDGTKWRFSLYGVPGKPDVDLSVIAKRYGGGGHKQACGGTFGAALPTELGGPLGHLLQVRLMDTPANRSLFQRFNAGEGELRERFHELMRPILDEAFTHACADPRLSESLP